jgi:uncharacterized membrane protein HdeD (DUF308 family)
MLALLTRNWWALIVRGTVAILFGILAFTWPGLTLAVLVMLFGAFALVDGIFAIVMAISGWHARNDRWLLLLEGGLGIIIGALAYRAPGLTTVGLLLFIAAWSLMIGLLKIAAAISLRKEIAGEGWLATSGGLSIVFAVILMSYPLAGALGMVWFIAAYAIVLGITQIVLGFRIHSARHRIAAATGTPAPSF